MAIDGKTIINALSWRYSTKVFDPTKKVSDADLHTILEAGRLAPSSQGLEPWTFLVVQQADMRNGVRAATFDQPKVTDAPYLIVVARRRDAAETAANDRTARVARVSGVDPATLQSMHDSLEQGLRAWDPARLDDWNARMAFIPFAYMTFAAALLGIDTGVAGIDDQQKLDATLGLPEKNLASTAVLAIGYRDPSDSAALRPKVRREFDEAVIVL